MSSQSRNHYLDQCPSGHTLELPRDLVTNTDAWAHSQRVDLTDLG